MSQYLSKKQGFESQLELVHKDVLGIPRNAIYEEFVPVSMNLEQIRPVNNSQTQVSHYTLTSNLNRTKTFSLYVYLNGSQVLHGEMMGESAYVCLSMDDFECMETMLFGTSPIKLVWYWEPATNKILVFNIKPHLQTKLDSRFKAMTSRAKSMLKLVFSI